MCKQVKLTDDKYCDNILHVYINNQATSLGIAKAFAFCCNLQNITCEVIGCKYLNKEHYFNYIEIPLNDYPMYKKMIKNNSSNNNVIRTCIDISATIISRTCQFITQDFIYNSIDRMKQTHQLINYFVYNKNTQTLHKIQKSIVNFELLRQLMFDINNNYLKQQHNQQYLYYEIYFQNIQTKQESLSFIDSNKQFIPQIMQRFKSQYQFYTIQDNIALSLSLTFIFKKISNQEPKTIVLQKKIKYFDEQAYEYVSDVINNNKSINKYIVNLDEKIQFQYYINIFNEQKLLSMINLDQNRIGLITQFSVASHSIILIITHLSTISNINNCFRINKDILDQNMLNIYSQIVEQLIEQENDLIYLRYIDQITTGQIQYLLKLIHLDYPELFWMKKKEKFKLIKDKNKNMFCLILDRTQLQFRKIQKMKQELDNLIRQFDFPKYDQQLQQQQIVIMVLIKYYFHNNKLKQNEQASSAYDFLVNKQFSNESINMAYSYLCLQCGIPVTVIQSQQSISSQLSDSYFNDSYYISITHYDQSHQTISDLAQLYDEKIIFLNKQILYLQSCINIDQNLFQIYKNSQQQFDVNKIENINYTCNKIYTNYCLDNQYGQLFNQLINIVQVQYQNSPINSPIYLSYRNIEKDKFLTYLKDNILNIQNVLISKYHHVLLGQYEIYHSISYPVLVLRFQENNQDTKEINQKISNFNVDTVKYLLSQSKQQIEQNQRQWFIRLQNNINPIVYETQYVKNGIEHIFSQYFNEQMKQKRFKLKCILSAKQYVLSWYIEPLN